MRSSPQSSRGFTLIEVLIAIGLVATTFPLIFAMLAQNAQRAKRAEQDTRTPFIAQQLIHTIQRGQQTPTFPFNTLLSSPQFPTQGDWIGLLISPEGKILRTLDSDEINKGSTELANGYIALARGLAHKQEGLSQSLCKVEIRIQTPSSRPIKKRISSTFFSLLPPLKSN